MKKKIALLLAGVMALTTLPMTAFAATSVGTPATIRTDGQGETLFTADLYNSSAPTNITGVFSPSPSYGLKQMNNTGYTNGDANGFDVTQAAKASIALPSGMKTGDQIDLTLQNAKWAFNYYAYGDQIIINGTGGDPFENGAAQPSGYTPSTTGTGDIAGGIVSFNSQGAQSDINKEMNGGSQYNDNASKLFFAAAMSDYINTNATQGNLTAKPTFSAKVSNTNDNVLTLTYTGVATTDSNATITVPVAAYTDQSTNPVKLAVGNGQQGSSMGSSGNTVVVANPAGGSTDTSIDGADTSKTSTKFDIITKENRAGVFSLASWQRVKYTVPSGFSFTSVGGTTLDASVTALAAGDQPSVTNLPGSSTIPANVYLDSNASTGAVIKTAMFVEYDLTKLATQGSSPITMRLNNVTVTIDSSVAKYGDILMTVDGSSTTGKKGDVSSQDSLVVGTYIDWLVTLKPDVTSTTPPALVSGRLDFNVTASNANSPSGTLSDDNIFDKNDGTFKSGNFSDFDGDHKTLVMKFEEQTPSSWWAGRDTTFTLPDKVNIIGVKIDQVKNVKKSDGTNWQGTGESADSNFLYNSMLPFDKDDAYIKMENNVMTISGLTTKSTDKASFRVVFWVASDANFGGDITCTLGGPGVPDVVDPVTIATTIVPYKVDTQVTNVQIGYQAYSVANISISETDLGRFLSNESLYVAFDYKDTAAASSGLIFRNANVQVVSGDLGIKGSSITNGNIKIDFNGASSKSKPSTIQISNVSISMDRNVPETNAEPFALKISTDNKDQAIDNQPNVRSTIRYGAITAPYVNVITKASSSTNGNTVSVVAGSTTATVNGVDVVMDTAPFIDPATSSMMVPVRFVSVGCGVPDDNVIWDPVNETVTIITGVNGSQIVQFKVGSSNYTLNGVSIPNANGAVTQIQDSRCFIPMRTLGNALGVPTSWDETTGTATFNGDMNTPGVTTPPTSTTTPSTQTQTTTTTTK